MIQTIKSPIANPMMWKQKYLLSGIAITLGTVSLIISNIEMIASMLTKVFQVTPWESMGGALFIFGLRLTDVPIGTLKTVLMVRGVRTWATLLGLLEVTIWITAMGRVMGQLDNPWNIAGYALGYSVGTWLGMWIENRLAFGSVAVHAISLTKSTQVAESIRAVGYGATQFQGFGASGPVCIVSTIVERKHLDGLLKNIHEVDPGAFVTVDDTRKVIGGHHPGR
jgi:uncharacterized protein YebE (UPF0316 family)